MMPNATKCLTSEILTKLPTTVEANELEAAAQYLQLHLAATPLSGDWEPLVNANTSQRIVAILQAVITAPPVIDSREVLLQRLRQLQKELRELPVLRLQLAVSPSPAGGEQLSRLTRTLFGRETVMDVEIDPALLGGAILAVGGRYFDRSLRSRLQQQWPALKEQLAKELATPPPAAIGEVGGGRLEAGT